MAKSKLEGLFKDLQEASVAPQNQRVLFDDSLAKVRLGIEVPDVPKVRIAMGRLSNLSVWTGRVGAVQVLEGEINGWQNLKLSAIYKYWCIRFFAHVFLVDSRTVKATRADGLDACLCFHHLVSTGAFEEAAWLGAAIKRSHRDKSMNWISKKLSRPFEAFTPRLFNIWQRRPIDDGLEPNSTDIYQAVIDAWSKDPTQLVPALKDVCDYHMARIDDPNDEGFPEFIEFFYAGFPAEVIAIQRIRNLRGLTTLPIDHPLMSTPLAMPPQAIDVPQDKMLDSILGVARTMWPSL